MESVPCKEPPLTDSACCQRSRCRAFAALGAGSSSLSHQARSAATSGRLAVGLDIVVLNIAVLKALQ